MADQKRGHELFSNICCSKHPGDTVARYCQDCRELLCISCIMAVTGDVHRQHAVISYQRYMKERVQELQELVHRLGTLRLRAEHFVRLLAHYNEEYEKGYNEILESFTVVRESMAKWKDDQIEDLDIKKTQQLKIISEAASLTSKGVACKGVSVKLPRVDIYMQQAIGIVLNLVPMLRYILRPGHSSLKKIRPISGDHTYDDISSTSGSSSADSSVMLGESAYSPRMLWLSRQLALSNSPVSFKQPPSNAKHNHPGMLPVPKKDDLPGQDNNCYSSDEESYLSSLPFHISKEEEEEEEEVEEVLHNNAIVAVDEDKHSALHHIADKPASLNSRLLTLKKAHSSFLPPPLPPPRPSQGLQDKPILREHGRLNTRPRSTSSPPQIRKFKIDHGITQDTIQNDSVNTPDGEDSEYEEMYVQNDTEQCHSGYPLLPAPETEPNYESLPYERILALPQELIIPPKQIIMASCCAVVPSENVCLYDLCISPDGYMIFTDKENSCLRCILGTSVDSKAITKRCKGSQPRAIAFDSCDQRILLSTAQGFYQLKCGPNLKNMKEKRLSKDMMPLSLTCSTVPVAKKKSQSLMYVTLWPSNGESCAYRFDTNGQFESRISSPDISNKKPHGIDYMKEYLVVTCLRDGTLAKISHMGDSLWDSSVDARRPGILKHPFGVAILPRTKYIAVTERDGHRVSIFSDQGKLILRFGEKGTERGKFDSPRGIAVRMTEELVVVDCGNKRVQIFLLSSFDLPLFPQ